MKHSRRGFYDWLVQRVSAVLIAAYTVFLMGYILLHAPLTFTVWHGLFDCIWMRVSTVIVLLAIMWHAWIGLWTVFTDYIKNRCLRLTLEVLLCLLLMSYLIWCLDSLWR